jgi:hypothetical protein
MRSFFLVVTLDSVAYQLYCSTALLDLLTDLKRIFALSGFGRLSSVYLLGSVNATICFPLPESVSITGTVIAMDSDDFWVSITGTVILIAVCEVFPPKIFQPIDGIHH